MQCRKTLRQKLKAFVDSTKILRRSKDNMNKKFLSLVLALVMVLGTLTPVFAEEAAAPKDKIEKAAKTAPSAKVQWLVDEKIVSGRKLFKDGDEKTDLSLDKNLQRDEITRLLVLGKGLENLANLVQGTMRPYVDVDNSNWANGVITVGSYHLKNTQGVPMLAGYPGNKFLPTRNVSYAELAKMLVCLVDNSITPKMVANFQWPSDWMVRAANLGILAGVEVKDSKAFVTRQAAFEMLYNALYLYNTDHHVDYGTKMGVVSGYVKGELVINQGDKAFKVKVSEDTILIRNSGFIGGLKLNDINNSKGLYIGSLVRVIADKDGNATYIVELGNPVDGIVGTTSDRWFGVSDYVAEGYAKVTKDDIRVYDGTFGMTAETFNKGMVEANARKQARLVTANINFTSNTRYFVADEIRGQLTEVNHDTAIDLLVKDNDGFTPKVYVGYDVNTGRGNFHGANIVVFNLVSKDGLGTVNVRVLNPSNGAYAFNAEKSNAEQVTYDLSKYSAFMPGYHKPFEGSTNTAGYYGQFDKLNVVKLALVPESNVVVRAETLINYLNDPIFKVVSVRPAYAGVFHVTLQGRDGRNNPVTLPEVLVKDTEFFTNKQSLEGNYLQLAAKALDGKAETGFYIGSKVLPKVASILTPGQVEGRSLALIAEGQGQNATKVQVTLTEGTSDFINQLRVYTFNKDNINFDVPNDKYAEVALPGSQQYYCVSKEDGDAINKLFYTDPSDKTTRNDVISVTLKATVVDSNIPGYEKQLKFDFEGIKTVSKVKVTFDANKPANADASATVASLPAVQKFAPGIKATKPAAEPTLTGYKFGGWFTDKACSAGKEYKFDTAVNADITLYAKWTAQ